MARKTTTRAQAIQHYTAEKKRWKYALTVADPLLRDAARARVRKARVRRAIGRDSVGFDPVIGGEMFEFRTVEGRANAIARLRKKVPTAVLIRWKYQ